VSTPATSGLRHWQRSHIETVMQVADVGLDVPSAQRHDAVIRASWQRCVHQHRLDPTRMQQAVIVTSDRLREHQAQMDGFLPIARHGLEALYAQVAGLGYCVLLTDDRGITVDFIGDLALEPNLRRAGLYLGADWSEANAGTCGVGTCLTTGQALTVHLDDHFDATHIPLSCTTAPVFTSTGELAAVLDISALAAAEPKAGQNLALQLVQVYAHHIENAAFLDRHRGQWVLRLSQAPQFLDVAPDYLLALDDAGRIAGHNRRAQQLLEPLLGGGAAPLIGLRSRLIGQPLERLFDATAEQLLDCSPARPAWQRQVRLAATPVTLHVLSAPPARRPAGPPMQGTPAAPPGPYRAAGPDASRRTFSAATSGPGAEAAPIGLAVHRSPGKLTEAAAPALPPAMAALSAGDATLERELGRAARLARGSVSVLIGGETGSGKEWLARAVHASSPRAGKAFVAVNCAAIPETLIESELFGHLPASFSGASAKGKRGLIHEADGGTLFLDEIGDMPLALQARLLRVLAERELLPVGATRPVAVDVRVIAATHADLPSLVEAGRFRADLYWRLNGAGLTLPPLRERADLAALVDRMLQQAAPNERLQLDAAARHALLSHAWPGNLRELRNVIDAAASLRSGDTVCLDDLPAALGRPEAQADAPGGGPGAAAATAARAADRSTMRAVDPGGVTPGSGAAGPPPANSPDELRAYIAACGGNVTAAARQLGVARMTIYRRLRRGG